MNDDIFNRIKDFADGIRPDCPEVSAVLYAFMGSAAAGTITELLRHTLDFSHAELKRLEQLRSQLPTTH